jgi:hypothetical protein
MSLGHLKQPLLKFQITIVAPILLLCATGARAESYDITIINATFSVECIGNAATCTEVINSSIHYNSVMNLVVSLSLAGTLTACLVQNVPGMPFPPMAAGLYISLAPTVFALQCREERISGTASVTQTRDCITAHRPKNPDRRTVAFERTQE